VSRYAIKGSNKFYEGWLSYLVGEPLNGPESSDINYAEGWVMAGQTEVCRNFAALFRRLREFGQVEVFLFGTENPKPANLTRPAKPPAGPPKPRNSAAADVARLASEILKCIFVENGSWIITEPERLGQAVHELGPALIAFRNEERGQ